MPPLSFEKRHLSRMPHSFNRQYLVLLVLAISQIVFGFFQNTPKEIYHGMIRIITGSDVLITDYIGQGNMGSAFVNSGLVLLMFTALLYRMRIQIVGVHFAGLFTIAGFALFGKNILNIWPPVIGTYLYARYKDEPFIHFLISAMFSTAFAPLVSEIMQIKALPLWISIPLAIFSGIILGFIIPNVGSSMVTFHHGFNLANIGFTAGMLGTIYVSFLKSYGFAPHSRVIWTTGNNRILGIYIFVMLGVLVLYGLWGIKEFKNHYKTINAYSGRLVTDFVILEGSHITFVNMGIVGMIVTAYILLIGGDLNGPTIGAIFSVVGFAAFGLHPRNVLPNLIGVYLVSLTKIFTATSPSIQLAALFSAYLAPIAGEYGVFWGIVAAGLHSSVVLNTTYLHGGLNLYNNGFSAGLIAGVLTPIIEIFSKEKM